MSDIFTEISVNGDISRLIINKYNPVIKYNFKAKNKKIEKGKIRINGIELTISGKNGTLEIKKSLDIEEHILGLGEKPFELERRRTKLTMWNSEPSGYTVYTDPIYSSTPFFISVDKNKKTGIFVNYPGKVTFDFGVSDYGNTTITVDNTGAEIFVITKSSIKDIIKEFTMLTGKPFQIPDWALGHTISRYSYFPEEKVIEVLKNYKESVKVDCVYLDIDYMNGYRLFEWDKNRFNNPTDMIKKIHKLGSKTVTIIDPSIKLDQNYESFKDGLGNYCETDSGELYSEKMWPGRSVYPDFFNKNAREWWGKKIKRWVSNYDIDGIWLDMNEPTVFNERRTFDKDVIHKLDDGRKLHHDEVHNAYPLMEAMATKEALGKDSFVLSRAGYPGIQKYAAMWSGDTKSSWEDMKIQIPLLLSMSISGMPYVGCDIGGFIGRSDPELLSRYYQMCSLFPIFRNHKDKGYNDQEIYNIETKYAQRIKKAIETRYNFIKYIKSLAVESSKYGTPIIRPLFYEFEDDENTYHINDQYMLGSKILFAPILERGATGRDVYIPNGNWVDRDTRKSFKGPGYIHLDSDMPVFIRENGDKIDGYDN